MISLHKHERGFSVIEGTLVIVIIAAIGTVGWYIHMRNANNTTTPVVAASSTQTPATSTSLPTSGTTNNDLQSDLSNITSTNAQGSQDLSSANTSLNDQSTMTSVPQ